MKTRKSLRVVSLSASSFVVYCLQCNLNVLYLRDSTQCYKQRTTLVQPQFAVRSLRILNSLARVPFNLLRMYQIACRCLNVGIQILFDKIHARKTLALHAYYSNTGRMDCDTSYNFQRNGFFIRRLHWQHFTFSQFLAQNCHFSLFFATFTSYPKKVSLIPLARFNEFPALKFYSYITNHL